MVGEAGVRLDAEPCVERQFHSSRREGGRSPLLQVSRYGAQVLFPRLLISAPCLLVCVVPRDVVNVCVCPCVKQPRALSTRNSVGPAARGTTPLSRQPQHRRPHSLTPALLPRVGARARLRRRASEPRRWS